MGWRRLTQTMFPKLVLVLWEPSGRRQRHASQPLCDIFKPTSVLAPKIHLLQSFIWDLMDHLILSASWTPHLFGHLSQLQPLFLNSVLLYHIICAPFSGIFYPHPTQICLQNIPMWVYKVSKFLHIFLSFQRMFPFPSPCRYLHSPGPSTLSGIF